MVYQKGFHVQMRPSFFELYLQVSNIVRFLCRYNPEKPKRSSNI